MGSFFAALKGRLALIGLAIAFAALAGLWFRADHLARKLQQAEAREAVALVANQAQARTIEDMQTRARLDAVLVRELAGDVRRIAAASAARTTERRELAEENDDVSSALAAEYPLDLVCLRDRQNGIANPDCAADDIGGASPPL